MLLPNGRYDDLETGHLMLDDNNQFITNLVQHPVAIVPNDGKDTVVALPVMLTKKERKKLRRQRRLEAQREKQDKIRMGLLPPEEPKLKLSNLMRVLGNDAIQDPTKMEAKVKEQMKKRQDAHSKHNEEKKLTEEERREKKRRKYMEDVSGGTLVAVFRYLNLTLKMLSNVDRVKDMSNPQHKYKVNINAQQFNMTGCSMLYHNMNVVIVEGGSKGMRAYKRLMLKRIDWSGKKKKGDDSDDDESEEENTDQLSNEFCSLVWEGKVKTPSFKKFFAKMFPTDAQARDFLEGMSIAHYWDAAKNHVNDAF